MPHCAGRPEAGYRAAGRVAAIGWLLTALLASAAVGGDDQAERALDSAEIAALFADVRDQAVLLDAPGTTAVNAWYADGRFVSEWRSGERSGRVTGRWYVRDGQRCVLMDGAAQADAEPRCGRITRRGNTYISYNPDGSRHGEHRLQPLADPALPRR